MYVAEGYGMSKDKAFIIEWQYRYSGGFTSALTEAIIKADNVNLERLAKGFPDEVEGYRKYRDVDCWWQDTEREFENKVKKANLGKE